jgi:D-glycero-alpha-D-manno-heptose-7-phosphate kinase
LLHEAWLLKHYVSNEISNHAIDYIYSLARKKSVLGVKLFGTGGGEFLLVCAPQEQHNVICIAMSDYRCLPFSLDWMGFQSFIIRNNNPSLSWRPIQKL